MSDSLWPVDCCPPDSSVHGDSPGKNTGVGCMPSSRDSPKPGNETGRPALQADSYRLSPREAHSGGNRLVDPGNHTQTRRPLPGWANSHLVNVGEETKRAIMAANPVFNCPWIYCRSGQKGSSPRSQVGSGQRNGTLSQGARVLNPGLSVYSTQSPKLCLTAVSVARSVSAFGC